MRYARSDVVSFSGRDGCSGHRRGTKDTHLVVDCPRCDPFLAQDPLWAGTLDEVPLTAEEQRAADAQAKESEFISAKMMEAFARQAKEAMLAEAAKTPDKPTSRRRSA